MENNVESVAKDSSLLNLSVRSTERSVLKELKYNEGASPTTKSPKETLTADQPEIQIKEANYLAGTGSNNVPLDGSGKAVNKNLLHVTSPTDGQSDDEEFLDCNTTFRSSSSSLNNNDDVAKVLDVITASDESHPIVEDQATSSYERSDVNANACVLNKKLNLGFIETGNLAVDSSGPDDVLIAEVGESDSQDTTISSSFIDNSGSFDQGSKVVSHLDAVENAVEVIAGSVETEPVIKAKTLDESEDIIESSLVEESKTAFEQGGVEKPTEVLDLSSVIRSLEGMGLSNDDTAANQTQILPNLDNSVVGHQEVSFTSNNIEANQTIVIEPNSPKFNQEIESCTIDTEVKTVVEAESPQANNALNDTKSLADADNSVAFQQDSTLSPEDKEVDQTVALNLSSSNEESKTVALELVTEAEPVSEFPEENVASNETQNPQKINNCAVVHHEVDESVVVESSSQQSNIIAIEAETVFEQRSVEKPTDVLDLSSVISSLQGLGLSNDDTTSNQTQILSNLDNSTNPIIAIEPNSPKSNQEIESCTIEVKTVIEAESPQANNALNKTECVANAANSAVCQKDSTFSHKNKEVDQAVALNLSSSKSDQNIESDTTATEVEAELPLTNSTLNDTRNLPNLENAAVVVEPNSPKSDQEVMNPEIDTILTEAEAVRTESESEPKLEPFNDSLNETVNLPYSAIDSTFSSNNNEVDQTVVVESSPTTEGPESHNEAQTIVEAEPAIQNQAELFVTNITTESKLELNESNSPKSGQVAENPKCDIIVTEAEAIVEAELVIEKQSQVFDSKTESESDSTLELPPGNIALDDTKTLDHTNNSSVCQQDSTFSYKNHKVGNPEIETIVTVEAGVMESSLTQSESDNPVVEAAVIEEHTEAFRSSFVVESESKLELPPTDNALNETQILPNVNNSVIGHQDATFISQNNEVDQAVVVESNLTKLDQDVERHNTSDSLKRSGTFEILNVDGVHKKFKPSSPDGQDDIDTNGSELQPSVTSVVATTLNAQIPTKEELPTNMVLSSNDFDFLQSRGTKTAISEEDRRSSLLLRFDPLSGSTLKPQFAPIEETRESKSVGEIEQQFGDDSAKETLSTDIQSEAANAVEMSVSLVHDTNNMDNETNAYANNIKSEIADNVPLNDKEIKFEYADENIRKKMAEYEATQELLVKRLTEKEKTLAKNCSIIEAYEKTLAELVADKEKLTDHHQGSNDQLRQERDIHHQHLMSLEITFSDLHKKYERSKEIAIQLNDRIDLYTEEKAMIDGLIKQQESRYERMKQHALDRLEYANSTLEDQEKNNVRENSRLKALLKIEEVSRKAMQEQLTQKCKENEELVKICDELIGGGQKS